MFFLSTHISLPTRHLQGTPLSTFWTPPFRPWSRCVTFPPHYLEYLRATNTMEHILLAFVRWQEAASNESSGSFCSGPGSAASLGVPTRLKDWIRGYPTMLPESATRSRCGRLQPRRGARTVRIVSVRRNVRMYTPDLIKTAGSWATRPPSGWPTPQMYSHNLAIESEWLHRRSS